VQRCFHGGMIVLAAGGEDPRDLEQVLELHSVRLDRKHRAAVSAALPVSLLLRRAHCSFHAARGPRQARTGRPGAFLGHQAARGQPVPSAGHVMCSPSRSSHGRSFVADAQRVKKSTSNCGGEPPTTASGPHTCNNVK
jgi:hypothetical protein